MAATGKLETWRKKQLIDVTVVIKLVTQSHLY